MKYLADGLSLVRVLAMAPFVLAAFWGELPVMFWILIAAWLTDLFDGMVARRFGSLRDEHPNFDADGLSDTAVAFISSFVLIFFLSGVVRYIWIAFFVLSIVSAVWMVVTMNKPGKHPIVAINMVIFHGLYQIGGVILTLAYLAYGSWTAVSVAIYFFPLVAFQHKKIKLWLHSQLQ